ELQAVGKHCQDESLPVNMRQAYLTCRPVSSRGSLFSVPSWQLPARVDNGVDSVRQEPSQRTRKDGLTMIRKLEQRHGNIYGYEASGTLTEDQIQQLYDELRDVIAQHGRIRLLGRM